MGRLLIICFLMSGPVFADGALLIFSWLMVGGPLGYLLGACWGVVESQKLRSGDVQVCSMFFSILVAGASFHLALTQLGNLPSFAQTGLGLFYGPLALGAALLWGRLPSRIFQWWESRAQRLD